MSKYIIYFIIISYLSLFNIGCSLFRPDSLSREDGYYTQHLQSCGPRAAQKAIQNLKKHGVWDERYITVLEVGKKIQNNGGNASRLFLSLFNHRTMQITFPYEMERFFEKEGFKVSRVKSLKGLDPETDTALVLVRGSVLSKYWHWVCFPTDHFIEDYFGKETKIHIILLVEKK